MDISATDMIIFSSCAIILGIFLLVRGGNMTVDGASSIAVKLGISPLIVAFTVVAFGTSLPELIVSVNAALRGSPGIALGNVVGSNIANILLILGVAAVLCPFTVDRKTMRNDFIMMLVATLFLMLLFQEGVIGRTTGIGLFTVLVAYVTFQVIQSKKNHIHVELESNPQVYSNTLYASFAAISGLVLLAVGADILVRGAVKLAEMAGVSETVIGLTIIAIGTSLPELTVAITASRKKNNDMVLGNVIGSNVFNVLCILGITGAVTPLALDSGSSFDIYFMAGVAAIFTVRAFLMPHIGRAFGIFMLVLYAGFLALQI